MRIRMWAFCIVIAGSMVNFAIPQGCTGNFFFVVTTARILSVEQVATGRSRIVWTVTARDDSSEGHCHNAHGVRGQLIEYNECPLFSPGQLGIQRQSINLTVSDPSAVVFHIGTLWNGTCVCAYRARSKPIHDPSGVEDGVDATSGCSVPACIG